jgi:hypothetical protein
MNKPKKQGTEFETWMVNWLNKASTVGSAERLAEGGLKDLGDIRFVTDYGLEWFIECKAAERLNVTRVLSNARRKSGSGKTTMLAWKRLVKPGEGKTRRVPDGEPVVIVMGLDTFHELLKGQW